MSENLLHPDDPRLTAYALGELDPTEQHEIERLLADAPAARAAVQEIRNLAGLLATEFRNEPAPVLTASQRSAILNAGHKSGSTGNHNGQAGSTVPAGPVVTRRKANTYQSPSSPAARWFATLATVAGLVVVAVVMSQPRSSELPQVAKLDPPAARGYMLWTESHKSAESDEHRWELSASADDLEMDASIRTAPFAESVRDEAEDSVELKQETPVAEPGAHPTARPRSISVRASSTPTGGPGGGMGGGAGSGGLGAGAPAGGAASSLESGSRGFGAGGRASGPRAKVPAAAAPIRRSHTESVPNSDAKSGQQSGIEGGRSSGKDEAPQADKAGKSASGSGLGKRLAAPVADEAGDEPAQVSKSDKVLRGGALPELKGAKSSAAGFKPQGSESAPDGFDRLQGQSQGQPNGESGKQRVAKKTNAAQLRGTVDFSNETNKAGYQYRSSQNDPSAPTADDSDKAEGRATAKPASRDEEKLLRQNAKQAKPDAFNKDLRDRKADSFTVMTDEIDSAATRWTRDLSYPDARRWKTMTENRGRYGRRDLAAATPEEIKLGRSLSREVSVHFQNAPLGEVVKRLADLSDVKFVLDPAGLEQEGINSGTSVSIDVESIRLTSVLTLMLEPLNLGFVSHGDSVVITSHPKTHEHLGDGANPVANLGDESYTPIVENSFLTAYENPLSTFGVDVDTASYSNVRRFLNEFQLPPRDAVRIEEFVNYFSYDYPQPAGEQPVSVSVDAANCPWNPTNQLVRVGLKGKEIPRDQRPPSNFVFLVDVSGSMQAANKLPLVQKGLNLLTDQMAETDQVGIVTYADTAVQRLETTNGTNKAAIHQVINSLQAGGSTNGADGIRLAYDAAARHFIAGGSNRVILCTDGDFNVGITGDALVEFVQERARSKVFSTVLGFGMGNVKDGFLEKLADKGNGQYAYIDREEEARKVFVENLSGTLTTIAKDVKLQIEFNPNQVGSYRLLGYENRVMPAADFKNDKIDAGDMGAGHTVTALYEIVPPAAAPKPDVGDGLRYRNTVVPQEGPLASELLTVRLRYKLPEADTSRLSEYPIGNTANVLAVSNGAGTPLEYSVRLQKLAPEDAAGSLRSFFVAGNPDSPVIQADSRSRLLLFRGNSDQVTESQKRLADRGEKLEPASRDLNWAAAVAAFGLILRDSEYRGQANFDMVLELATAAKGDDPTGRRQEFISLVQRAREIVNRRSEGRVVRLLSKMSDAERELVATVDGKYSNLLRIVAAPDDVAAYGSMREFGRWEGTTYAGQKDLPQGFWVYVYPNWYIWGNTAK